MARRLRCALVLAAVALAGCGSHRASLQASCQDGPRAVEKALAKAPSKVVLPDGTRLSDCVSHAISDTDLQNLGAVLIAAGDDLSVRAPRDPHAALQLGYLAGATERGASGTGGVAIELVDRMDRMGGDAGLPPAQHAAFLRGRRAGRTGG